MLHRLKSLVGSSLLPVSLGLIIKLLIRRPPESCEPNHSSSIVLGFGDELSLLDMLCGAAFGGVYIPNISKKRLKNPVLKRFLDGQQSVFLVSNIEEETVGFRDVLWLRTKLSGIYTASFRPSRGGSLDPGGADLEGSAPSMVRWRSSRKLDLYGLPVSYLPRNLDILFTESLSNTGLTAIHLAASRSSSVHCFGFNFYCGQAFCGGLDHEYGAEAAALRRFSSSMIRSFMNLVDYWEGTKFVLYMKAFPNGLESRANLEVVLL